MSSSRVIRIALWVAAAGTGAGAYLSRGFPLVSGLLALAGVCLLALAWLHGRKRQSDVLSDPAMSTLVFPPESKFQASGLPRH